MQTIASIMFDGTTVTAIIVNHFSKVGLMRGTTRSWFVPHTILIRYVNFFFLLSLTRYEFPGPLFNSNKSIALMRLLRFL